MILPISAHKSDIMQCNQLKGYYGSHQYTCTVITILAQGPHTVVAVQELSQEFE